MKQILVLGAGRSASSLISYLLEHAQAEQWKVAVADASLDLVLSKTNSHPYAVAIQLDVNNESELQRLIQESDIVISMLPPSLHILAAKICLSRKINLVTASYVSKELEAMGRDVSDSGLLFLNECGLDPGIDHMSAMKIIDHVREQGERIVSFRSYCGGLMSPESNTNPWGYKFTWNPRNVILAGQGGDAVFIRNQTTQRIPYHKLFEQIEHIEIEGLGTLDGYANRDSISYIHPYHLESIEEILRGTLRMPGFCRSWNELVKLSLCNDTLVIPSNVTTWVELIQWLNPELRLAGNLNDTLSRKMDDSSFSKLVWLGLFTEQPIDPRSKTPAQALQFLLEEKWKLEAHDKDMIVMQHEFLITNTFQAKPRKLVSTLVIKGHDQIHTAMAMTVGLPLAIATKNILSGNIKETGVKIPVHQSIYNPVLKELETYGIRFSEKEIQI